MTFEYALELPAGPSYFNTTLVPVKDDTGSVARLIAVARDFTGRKRAEAREKEHERQIFQAAKLASLGTLVSGIAHEINNPNNFIRLNVAELQRVLAGHPPGSWTRRGGWGAASMLRGIPVRTARGMLEDLVGGIEEGSKRIEKLVVNLRDFARGDEGELTESVDVNAVIDSAVMIDGR